ncbi:MAG: hypothetical protein M3R46_04655 [Actinomycetota bacterium]|nr:hypothetical protein [Actinomycetota bacterium]
MVLFAPLTWPPWCVVYGRTLDPDSPGWSLHITAARTADTWHLLEVGFVYP